MTKLIAYDFSDRRKIDCYKCGGWFREGRYREHIRTSNRPEHAKDQPIREPKKEQIHG